MSDASASLTKGKKNPVCSNPVAFLFKFLMEKPRVLFLEVQLLTEELVLQVLKVFC